MCGICGVWYFDPASTVEPQLIASMRDEMTHRGPDEAGIHTSGPVGLGFRRLSIIDLDGSHQPMPNEDEQVWITFNGEIYNFQALRHRLADRHCFRTVGDTETIIHAYEEFGSECVKYLRGMFAFAIWDARQQRLTCAVDRFGKKPLYYLLDHEKFIFASELKGILQCPGVDRDLDLDALDEYLAYGYITAPRTVFRSIRKLQPGHTLVVTQSGVATVREYWHPALVPPEQWLTDSVNDLAARLRGVLLEAVRLRMVSDVPLGAFLSGGVDSSAVVGLMSKVSAYPVRTFTIGFEEALYDETSYAQLVADTCGTEHTREVVRPDIVTILPKLVHQFDEPFADSSMIPTYYVSQVARQHVTVVLSGDGGDEIFGGYPWYRYGLRQMFLQSFVPASLRPVAGRIGAYLPKATKIAPYVSVIDRAVAYWGMRTDFFDPAQRAALYKNDVRTQLRHAPGEQQKIESFKRAAGLDGLSQLQYSDLLLYMPGDILTKVDRCSMLASLEVRCPLLDHEVFEFMARIPSRYRMNLTASKILLKKAVGDLLPPQIHTRNKWGFSIPLGEWLRGPLADMLCDTLLSPNAASHALFDAGRIHLMFDHNLNGTADHASRLWSLLCLELWMREYACGGSLSSGASTMAQQMRPEFAPDLHHKS
ncbi:MAG: asparagine synthase (glutamine-hydrolyzing) [Anaerolineae bacterium]|nr:asparagine synthase (glutamine-hydrolyzing) [Anaerolineae bacterium]